ncbi:MAG: hypothetical protein KA715_11470 [Xanthomonadaceae bacterium]|nr:hypothetical protein [Xanthomonadaceae bacterium]
MVDHHLTRSREFVVRVITEVLNDKVTIAQAWSRVVYQSEGREPHDAPWCREMVAGILRYKSRLDWIMDTYSHKKKPTGWTRKALYLGIYPLLAQEAAIPGKIVSEVVDFIKEKQGSQSGDFVNAVLRQVTESLDQWKSWKPSENSGEPEWLAWTGLPEWLWERLSREYGREWAIEFSQTMMNRPEFYMINRDGKTEKLAGDPGESVGSDSYVQDLSSQALVKRVHETLVEKGIPEADFLDICSAPGGKAIGLAFLGHSGIAMDESPKRLELVRENIKRLGLAEKIRIYEQKKIRAEDQFELVWVDAPCTGIGTLRKNPEIRWVRDELAVEGLIKLQRKIVEDSLKHVKPSGFFVYSVCSVLKDEFEHVAEIMDSRDAKLVWKITIAPQEAPHGDGFQAGMWFRSP